MKPCTIIILIALFVAVSASPSVMQSVKTTRGETTPTGEEAPLPETIPTGAETTPTGVETTPLNEFCIECSYVCEILQQQATDPTISFTEAYIATLNNDLCYPGGIIEDDDAFCYNRGDIDAIFKAEGNIVDGNGEVYYELCASEPGEA